MLLDPFNNTVICICTFMVALESLEARVLGDFKSDSVLDSELLELGYNTVGDVGYTLA